MTKTQFLISYLFVKESIFPNYIIKLSKMFHGLSKMQTKELAHKFAIGKKKTFPSSWKQNKAAGEDWLKSFRHKHIDIALRLPKATILARAGAFDRHNVERFFENLQLVYTRDGSSIPPQYIFNLDENDISTVQKPAKVLALTGIKQIGKIMSAERGANVTMCANQCDWQCIATRFYISPCLF